MSFWDTVASVATGGVSDAVRSVADVINNSGEEDWQRLLTSGLSDIYRGYADGSQDGITKGWMKGIGGVVDNPLINASDDYLTDTGTIFQRLVRDVGIMPEDVYEKNYDYTKDIAHAVGLMFAGGASSALPAGDAGAGAAAAMDVGATVTNTEAQGIIADMYANQAYNQAIQQGLSEELARQAAEQAGQAAMRGMAKGALQATVGKAGLKSAQKIGTKEAQSYFINNQQQPRSVFTQKHQDQPEFLRPETDSIYLLNTLKAPMAKTMSDYSNEGGGRNINRVQQGMFDSMQKRGWVK